MSMRSERRIQGFLDFNVMVTTAAGIARDRREPPSDLAALVTEICNDERRAYHALVIAIGAYLGVVIAHCETTGESLDSYVARSCVALVTKAYE